jgi:hypothetical protein
MSRLRAMVLRYVPMAPTLVRASSEHPGWILRGAAMLVVITMLLIAASTALAACARPLKRVEIVRIAIGEAEVLGCFDITVGVDADRMNTTWKRYRATFPDYDPSPMILENRPADSYWAVYFRPPATQPPQTDGDLFVFIDACDGAVLDVMAWCGNGDTERRAPSAASRGWSPASPSR